MAREPTRSSRISTGYNDSVNSIAESDADFSFFEAAGTNLTLSGALTAGGGTAVAAISTGTAEIDLGSLTSKGGGSLVTVGLAGAVPGDTIIINPDSEWSNYNAVHFYAYSGDTTGEVNVVANASSSITAVNPAAVVFRLTRINFASFI
jgi:hypothetical protein